MEYPKNETDNCNKCDFYLTIDSGYGWCRRYPPTQVSSRPSGIFGSVVRDFGYSIVPWNQRSCGERKFSVSVDKK